MTQAEAQVLKIVLIAGVPSAGAYFVLNRGFSLSAVQALVVTLGAVIAVTAITCPFYAVGGPSGFRNPWVYASRRSWVVSQWAAAIVLSLLGTGVVVFGLRNVETAILVLVFGLPTSVLALCILSWAAWRHDPGRRPLE